MNSPLIDLQSIWLPFNGDRMHLRTEIESCIRKYTQDPSGKLEVRENGPFWIGEKTIHLSYSHTRTVALLVFSEQHPLGVDIEATDRAPDPSPLKIAERYFHKKEHALLEALSADSHLQAQLFLEFWTKKEAHGKLTRKGLKESIHLEVATIPDVRFITAPEAKAGYLSAIAFWA